MKRILQYSTIIIAILGGWWALNNQYAIRDWYTLRSYDPPADIVQYANDTAMSDYGRKLFYVSDPQVEDKEEFNQNCQFTERSIVLGCYTNSSIFLYGVDEARLDGVEEVTAAHEMLHAGYSRLSSSEKKRVNGLLDKQMEQLNDSRIKELVEQYKKEDPDSLQNEMHSIFGTEVRELTPELEEYYTQYFNDRLTVVAISESYEQVFVDSNKRIVNLETDIVALKNQISQLEGAMTVIQVNINDESGRLDDLKASGDIPSYNAGVPAYNAMIVNYNSTVDSYKILVNQHNDKVDERNRLATDQNDLVHSLDSKYEKL